MYGYLSHFYFYFFVMQLKTLEAPADNVLICAELHSYFSQIAHK